MNIDLARAPRPHLRLRAVLGAAPASVETLTMWRCVPDISVGERRSPRDAKRSATYAGRWHHPAETLALYTAETRGLAMSEAAAHFPPGDTPVTVAELQLSGKRVLRLESVAGSLRWPLAHLLDDGRGYLRAILVGTEACRAGIDILVVPSAVDLRLHCAVCFMRHRPRITILRSTSAVVHA